MSSRKKSRELVPVTGAFERAVRDNAAGVGDGEEQRHAVTASRLSAAKQCSCSFQRVSVQMLPFQHNARFVYGDYFSVGAHGG
jgi:hypothetical protein